jgi:pimeloyl-ACP methyl ester carboxylesterase
MNPFFFGSSARQLFGAYEPPPDMGFDAAVLCNPFGYEYLIAHPALRFLSKQLASAGQHVLRFDYTGTGDSAGDFEAATHEQWVDDINVAISELKDIAQVQRILLIGLRFGATLAALAARNRSDVDRLVLWDPIWDGSDYLNTIGVGAPDAAETVDVRGMALTPRARQELAAVTLDTFAPPLPRTLLLSTVASPDADRALYSRFLDQGVDCEFAHVPDVSAWIGGDFGSTAMPVAAVRRIVSWLV